MEKLHLELNGIGVIGHYLMMFAIALDIILSIIKLIRG